MSLARSQPNRLLALEREILGMIADLGAVAQELLKRMQDNEAQIKELRQLIAQRSRPEDPAQLVLPIGEVEHV